MACQLNMQLEMQLDMHAMQLDMHATRHEKCNMTCQLGFDHLN
jgi:hypothetical protein